MLNLESERFSLCKAASLPDQAFSRALCAALRASPPWRCAYLCAAAVSGTQKVALPKGTGPILSSVPVGDGGKLRLRTSKKSKLKVAVVSYTNEIYTALPATTAR